MLVKRGSGRGDLLVFCTEAAARSYTLHFCKAGR